MGWMGSKPTPIPSFNILVWKIKVIFIVTVHRHLLGSSLFSQLKTEPSNSIIMPVMVVKEVNLEEQLESMNKTLERLVKEYLEKDT